MENDILDSLEDLGYNGPLMKDGALLKCVKNADITLEFMGLCKWLTDEIQVFTGIIENITGADKDEFSIEISGFLREYGCSYPELMGVNALNTKEKRLLLLGFLTSELQACRMLGLDDKEMDIEEAEASPAFKNISAILSALHLSQPNQETSIFNVFSDIEKKVNDVIRQSPRGFLGEPLLTKRLSPKQWAQVEQINKTLSREYSLRRQTLLMRLDVTVRSFQWSELGMKKQDSISGDFQPIRRSLEIHAPVSIADVLAARTDLTKVTKTSGGEIREKTKCAVNRIMIGKVPFRGGKPSSQPPPPDMPQFSKRQEPPKDQRGNNHGGARGTRGRRGGGSGGNRGNRLQGGSGWTNGGGDNRDRGPDHGRGNKGWGGNQNGRGLYDGNPFGNPKSYFQHDTYRS